ncbi:MAG: thiamine pyrophosphate-dependent enzyme [Polyangia bacterium]
MIPGELPPLPADHPALSKRQILDESGALVAGKQSPIDDAKALHVYGWMLRVRTLDDRLMAMQRQGRIGFYAEIKGQEGAVIGAASALAEQDWIVPALREAGAGLYRGLPMSQYVAQIFGNANDVSKGHAMPCHPGLRSQRYLTMSSCIGSQLPHAVGLAMAAQTRHEPVAVLACLGEGATSEPDFHVAANLAGVRKAPVVFFCMNNQWAISTPSSMQTAAPTFAVKALGYGFPGVRVDGNDPLAVHEVVKEATERARRGDGPTLIEALTYRVSAHTSSDDPSRYRDEKITADWRSKRDPIARLGAYLRTRGVLDDAKEAKLRAELDAEVREVIAAEEAAPLPELRSMIEDVYAEIPTRLVEQLAAVEKLPRQKTGGVHA